ncbi:leucine-rich repeat-containing protein 43 isoform X4 [Saimiri boliviensis]|uniref:leucine-rich repeat-containing protein 43 isoform X4 n=1 Tax=Saimiri boliviensis TaxID=27679 RepID=UPI00193EBC0F|nr:leucine-rich repeat-containing protein 43 isoform X2 [Saimiri boliviensis boliviensis]
MEASSESESEDGPGTQRPGTGTVSAAVREHLRKLCLREFPCGSGSWNKSRFLPQTWRTWRELVPREENVVSPGEETVEALLGLVRSPHSPWALLNDSNSEDSFLRELAIRNPLMIRDTFFYSYFRSLRVVDKEVTLVDKDLLKFLKLEELVLSANRIKEVEAANLPPTLKVLELYGNEISSMECLCAHPPPGLQHLGLGHNKLLGPSESLHITTDHWPNLVSLDLGFNDLTDLQSMLASLRTLRHLRLLVLQGNPLALVPYYRGLTVDSLAQLCVLDDITVSPNEKHLFRGLSLNGDLLAQEAQFVVTIGNIRGVLDASLLDPEPGPEGPFITYSYYVTYDFVKDEEGEANEYPDVLAEIVKPSPSLELLVEESPEEVIESVIEDVVEEVTEEMEGSLESEVEEWGESEVSIISVPSTVLPTPRASAEELAKLRPRIDPRLCPSPGTVLFNTTHKPWAEVIPCNYEMQHVLRDLVPLKAFLLAGTTVTIVEEKILSWPVALPAVDSPLSAKKGKGEKDKKEKEKDGKGKGEKEPAKVPGPGAGEGGPATASAVLVPPRRTLLASPSRHQRRRKSHPRSSGRTPPPCRCWAEAWWFWSPCWWGSPWCPPCATLAWSAPWHLTGWHLPGIQRRLRKLPKKVSAGGGGRRQAVAGGPAEGRLW